ncbi:hypothetical protein LSAT2_032445 [Lamellibrachia satsuma]|nr:hypothetical protein LSAT2_032445 [Lamellibrachia satsuma]
MSQLNGGPVSGQTPRGLSSRLRHSGQLPGQQDEIQILHSVIVGLQQEILLCNNQKKRATDQLACLITLVKNAWEGDKEASQNVGKIVGVSPPEIEIDFSLQQSKRVIAKVKPNVINRWARLSMGVLNREYKKHEMDIEMRQRMYLLQRNAYLDEQMSLNVQHEALHTASASGSQYLNHPEQVTVKYRKGSANTTRRRPTSKHLYRQPVPL